MDAREREFPVIPWIAYNAFVVPATIAGLWAGSLVRDKVRRGREGRRRLRHRIEVEASRLRGGVWFHASSAGEFEQARPLIQAFVAHERDAGRSTPTLLTVFSPSGHAHATENPETDVIEYLPLDTWRAAQTMLSSLRPRALVMVKNDCWPNLVWAAHRRGIPLVLASATLSPASQRLRPGVRGFLRSVYRCFDRVGAIDASDARRLTAELGVEPARIEVTGDTRVDRVRARWQAAEGSPLVRAFDAQEYRYLAVGSSWPGDERVVLAPLLDLIAERPGWGVILAPHEPRPRALDRLEQAIRDRDLPCSRLSELVELRTGQRRSTAAARDRARWRVVLVDTVGQLAELYRATQLAYVGGGFGQGVHSVLEPAVTGQPVLFGPAHRNALEASRLIERGGGFLVSDRATARQLLHRFVDDEVARSEAGNAAQRYVLEQENATERNLELVLEALASAQDPA